MKKFCVIVAGGSGSRMGNAMPKQLLNLMGKPMLLHTVDAFLAAFADIRLIVVMHPNYVDSATKMLEPYPAARVEPGAATRTGSVNAGLRHVDDDSMVFVHDAVRCLPSTALIHRCYSAALEIGNAVPAVAAVDSLRIVDGEQNEWLDRSRVKLVQTPQTFRAAILKKAYGELQGTDFLDDAQVVERSGVRIHLVEGETTNIKVTYPADLLLAEMILKQRQ